jgi:hypothetical protein
VVARRLCTHLTSPCCVPAVDLFPSSNPVPLLAVRCSEQEVPRGGSIMGSPEPARPVLWLPCGPPIGSGDFPTHAAWPGKAKRPAIALLDLLVAARRTLPALNHGRVGGGACLPGPTEKIAHPRDAPDPVSSSELARPSRRFYPAR